MRLSVETCYFGTDENKLGIGEAIDFGVCFAKDIKRFLAEQQKG